MKILVSGFEPFAGETQNPSLACIKALCSRDLRGGEVHTLSLPVSRAQAPAILFRAMSTLRPGAIVLLGEAGGRTAVTPERIAINVDDFQIADNTGARPRNCPIVAEGPAGYFSTLPLQAMVDAMHAAEIPAGISNSAGTYLCNHLFYRVMHYLAVRPLGPEAIPLAGFIHLPYLSTQALDTSLERPSLPLAVMHQAISICIQTLIDGREVVDAPNLV